MTSINKTSHEKQDFPGSTLKSTEDTAVSTELCKENNVNETVLRGGILRKVKRAKSIGIWFHSELFQGNFSLKRSISISYWKNN